MEKRIRLPRETVERLKSQAQSGEDLGSTIARLAGVPEKKNKDDFIAGVLTIRDIQQMHRFDLSAEEYLSDEYGIDVSEFEGTDLSQRRLREQLSRKRKERRGLL